MKHYEYRRESLWHVIDTEPPNPLGATLELQTNKQIAKSLNAMGAEGWLLCAADDRGFWLVREKAA